MLAVKEVINLMETQSVERGILIVEAHLMGHAQLAIQVRVTGRVYTDAVSMLHTFVQMSGTFIHAGAPRRACRPAYCIQPPEPT